NYVYQTLSGDGTIVAQVASNADSGTYAKAGIMFRDSTAADAGWVTLALDQGSGAAFEYRNGTGQSAQGAAYDSGIAPPQWLKLVRSGDTFSAFISSDGTTWTQVGSNITVDLASTALVGLAVDSYTSDTLNTATFQNVVVTPGQAPTVSGDATVKVTAFNNGT